MKKNVLIACSNYYPHSFGGTEVYVEGYANFMQEKGDTVYIITAAPSAYFTTENTIYTDDILKVCRYFHNNTMVFGVNYQNTIDTELIYSKYHPRYNTSWEHFIRQQPELCDLTILHIHSFTATIGLNLFKAVIKQHTNIRVITSYHTAISCPKGTLMYGNTLNECHIKPNVKSCTNCLFKTQNKLPYLIVKGLNCLHLTHTRLPAILKTKHLVSLEINAFEQLKEITHQWWCYSNGIKNILILNGIDKARIKMARHGIADVFFAQTINKPTNKTIYLYSGRLAKIKGIITLLKAWLQLPLQTHKQLWLTTSPISQNAEINNLLNQAVLRGDIVFLGEKIQKEIAKLYAKVYFVIIPSECFEIGPLVFHEAIANKCNVICSDVGGCKELAHVYHENTITFKAGDINMLSSAIANSQYTFMLQNNRPQNVNNHLKMILQ